MERILSWIKADNMSYSPETTDANVDPKAQQTPKAFQPPEDEKSNSSSIYGLRSVSFYPGKPGQPPDDSISRKELFDHLEKMENMIVSLHKKVTQYERKKQSNQLERTLSL
jgi:hypothetical protein